MTFTPRPFGGLFVCVFLSHGTCAYAGTAFDLLWWHSKYKKAAESFCAGRDNLPWKTFFFFSPADKISLLKCLSLQHGGTGIQIPDFLCKMLSHFNALLNRRLFFLLPQPKVPFYYTVFPRTSFSGCL